jgi:hypothetical protein
MNDSANVRYEYVAVGIVPWVSDKIELVNVFGSVLGSD